MRSTVVAGLAAVMIVALGSGAPARASDGGVDVSTLPGAIGVGATDRSNDESTTTTPTLSNAIPDGQWITIDVCGLGGTVVCSTFDTCPDGSSRQERWFQTVSGEHLYDTTFCPIDLVQPETPVTLTPGRIAEAFRRLPLPESPLLIQPSGGETIVNFDTIFYTTQEPFTRTVRLLGHEVTFSIEPARFTWVWGDGEQATTTTPGRPYHQGVSVSHNLTHRYLTADRFRPRLDTIYTATYSVDGRAARPVNGTVTITGTPQDLRTVEYTPVLVDD